MNAEQLTKRFLYYPDSARTGGTAKVYEGTDLHNRGEKVAIKIVNEEVVSRELANLAFERETKCLSQLRHPNIVSWVDAGKESKSNRKYFVTEWLQTGLFEHLKNEHVGGWDDFYTAYALPILQGLKFAFEQGVLHRDIKPNNLMVDSNGIPRIVDFGIASIDGAPKIGVTLASFKSVPYAPPDAELGRDEASRDVWGFAASCIACLNLAELTDYNDLEKQFQEFDAPPEVDEIFEKALSNDPALRYLSILDFAADLEAVQRRRQRQFSPLPAMAISIPRATVVRMQSFYPNADEESLRKRIVKDLNSEAAFRIKEEETEERDNEQPPDIEVVSGEHQYIVSVNKHDGAPLVIKGVRAISPFHSDKFIENAFVTEISFSLEDRSSRTDESEKALRLISEIEDHALRLNAELEKQKEQEFFNTWRDILRLKTQLADSEKSQVKFNAREIFGSRVELHCDQIVDENLVGQMRAIHLQNGYQLRGEVEEVNGNDVVIYLEDTPSENFPDSGTLGADNVATKLAIQRQQSAIDAIRYDRNVGARLKNALIHPELESEQFEVQIQRYFLSDLDPPKKRAVAKGLSDSSVTLVQGPPGTGKTQLIVELILQLIQRDKNSKILLTSQTHIALDNVLERLLSEAPDSKIVRVGRVPDKNAANIIKPLMIEEIAEKWRNETSKRSEEYLNNWAVENGINFGDIQLGRAVSRFSAIRREIQSLEKTDFELGERLEKVKQVRSDTHSDSKGETVFEKEEAERNLLEERDEIKRQIRVSKKQVEGAIKLLKGIGDTGKELVEADIEELGEWEEELLGSQKLDQVFRDMLDLSEEWQLRFSNSQELYPAILSSAQVVAGTCVGFAGAKGILNVDFDICIVDEASKATASEICVPMSRAERSFIVGDHMQLPPFLEEGLLSREHLEKFGLSRKDVEETLFERLFRKLPDFHRVILTKQYRMLPEIGDLVNECFYDIDLQSEPRDAKFDLTLAGVLKPVTWVSTSNIKKRGDIWCYPGFRNVLEAETIRDMLSPINFCLSNAKQSCRIALLTGYANQKEELRRQSNAVISELDRIQIECGTVDSFQGRQTDIAFFSITRSNEEDAPGFLHEFRRLNVALSRAKEALVIVGDFEFALRLPTSSPLRKVAEYVSDNLDTCAIRVIEK